MLALTLSLTLAATPRIAVMPIAPGEALADRAALAITDQLAAEVRRQGGLEVLTPRDAPGALSPDRLRAAQGCATDPGMAEVASALGADRLVAAEVSKVGDSLVLHARVIDARSVKAVAVADRRLRKGTAEDVLDQLPGVVRELLRAAAEPPRPGSDRLVLHLHRADGRYEASLYAWDSQEAGADLRQPVLVTRDTRVPTVEPDGHDDFGVLWIIPAAKFRSGRINFQVQQGGLWDECVKIKIKPPDPLHYSGVETTLGEAPFWLLSDGREAWMNVPECELHPTLERAVKAQRRQGKR